MSRARLRAVHSQDRAIAEFARDAQQAFDAMPEIRVLTLTATYAAPLVLAFDHEPSGVKLIRVRHDASPEDPILASACVSFVYRDGAIEITQLEGLTEGVRYRLCFEVVG